MSIVFDTMKHNKAIEEYIEKTKYEFDKYGIKLK